MGGYRGLVGIEGEVEGVGVEGARSRTHARACRAREHARREELVRAISGIVSRT